MAAAVRVCMGEGALYGAAAGVYDPELVQHSNACTLYRQRDGPWILYTGKESTTHPSAPFWYFTESEDKAQKAKFRIISSFKALIEGEPLKRPEEMRGWRVFSKGVLEKDLSFRVEAEHVQNPPKRSAPLGSAEAARPSKQRRIEYIWPVCCCHQNDALIAFESVHLS